MPTKSRRSGHEKTTNPLIWCFAILCTFISIAVIITGIVVFVGYLVIHPRVPVISVLNAHLDDIQSDQTGLLQIQITIVIRAENDNLKAHSSFSDTSFKLIFDGLEIAKLVNQPFDVSKNNSVDFNYSFSSSPIPLDQMQMEIVDTSLKEDRIRFDLKGSSRARWRIGLLGSVKFWCHLDCQLNFHPSNGSYIHSRCSSRAK